MKTIQQISIWNNGQAIQGTILNAYVISDNLSTTAQFYFIIYSDSLQQLTQGNLTMTGDAYTSYSSNQDAWNWIASELKIVITGDYVNSLQEKQTADSQPAQ